MADKSGKPSVPPGQATNAAAAAADAAEKARLKAERKAQFMATKGAQIAEEKAKKEQNKKQGKNKQKQQASSETGSQGAPPSKQLNDSTTSTKATDSKPQVPAQKTSSKSDGAGAVASKGSGDVPQKKSSATPSTPVQEATAQMKDMTLKDSGAKCQGKPKGVGASAVKKGLVKVRESKSQSRVQTLFDHLPKGVEPSLLFEEGVNTEGIHSAFITLGLMYSYGQLHGSNRRVIALLNVVGSFIESYVAPPEKDFKYDLAVSLKKNLEFLRKCRPFAVAMNNTVEFINGKLRDVEVDEKKSEKEIKTEIAEALQDFREERIDKATEAIVAKAKAKIVEGDVVLIYGSSDLVSEVIVEASQNVSFSLVIVDGRPYATERRYKGLDIIKRLDPKITMVKYTSITGLSNVIRGVTKIIVGAHGLLNNGGVLAHAGTSQIALMATANNIPFIVCCETLKFCDKSPTDSFFLNEIGTGFGLDKKITDAIRPEVGPYLVTPVIKYDVTPPELVTAVITDVDILPTTSVPVVLRVQENRPFRS